MLYHNVQVMAHSLRFVDAAVAAIGSTLVAWHVLGTGPQAPETYLPAMKVFVAVYFVAFIFVASRMRLYIARRTEDLLHELLALAEVILYACSVAAVAAEAFSAGIPGKGYLIALGASLILLPGLRLAMRFTIRYLRRGGDDYRVWLIIGHNNRSAEIARIVMANPHFGIRIEEVIDFAAEGGKGPELPAQFRDVPLSGIACRVLPSTESVRGLVESHVVDEVVVTLPLRSCYDRIRHILDICGEAGISVKLAPEAFEKSGFSTELSHVGAVPMVTHYSGPSNHRLLLLKRMLDMAGAAAGLLLLSPLFVALGLAVKLTSPGPVLFRQTRVGLHGRHFQMIKFRSMVKDAPSLREAGGVRNERDGTAFKIRNDSRITPVGRWLRKYHLDELPQLWNVLVGDMSLVGPRPLPVAEAFGEEWWQRRRLTMPPGLTCLWQLEDDPSIPFKEWMQLDMDYIDRWSLWLDAKLIVRTFATIAKGRGW
jgi:exopolysaccharide biosynthesis polyprenyl glycosylphosphotransferase